MMQRYTLDELGELSERSVLLISNTGAGNPLKQDPKTKFTISIPAHSAVCAVIALLTASSKLSKSSSSPTTQLSLLS